MGIFHTCLSRLCSEVEELQPSLYGLSHDDSPYDVTGILHMEKSQATLADVIDRLEKAYCGPLTAEFNHLTVRKFID